MDTSGIFLSEYDQSLLEGEGGPAAQLAMRVLISSAKASRAKRLISVSKAHIVGSYHSGDANLMLLRKFNESNAQVIIPTTLSSSGMDLTKRVDSNEFKKNCEVVEAYQKMGCHAVLTCAPYQLESTPKFGENIAWAESNAVVYVNSLVGARTNMTYQYLDLSAALTGRIPETGMYLAENRMGTKIYSLSRIPIAWLEDEGLYPLLGMFLGKNVRNDIPVLIDIPPTVHDDKLRAMGAAIATTGSASIFHVVGRTPEASHLSDCYSGSKNNFYYVTKNDILTAKNQLTDKKEMLRAICLGAPHFSIEEFNQLVQLLAGRALKSGIQGLVSTSRTNKLKLKEIGLLTQIEKSGFKVVVDSCTYYGSSIKGGGVMTNSAKWAYYAPANLGVAANYARLTDCIESGIKGYYIEDHDFWNQ